MLNINFEVWESIINFGIFFASFGKEHTLWHAKITSYIHANDHYFQRASSLEWLGQSQINFMSIEGQGHFLTLAKGHLELLFSETTGPFYLNFVCELSGTRE